MLSDLLTNCERVSDHCSNIAVAQIETAQNAYQAHKYLNSVKSKNNAEFNAAYHAYQQQYQINQESV